METLLQRAFAVNAPRSVAWDHLSRVEAWPSSGPVTSGASGSTRQAG